MKSFFKAIAVLIIIAHVFAVMIYTGVIPVGLLINLRVPDAGRLAEYILSLQDGSGEEEKDPLEEKETEETESEDNRAEKDAESGKDMTDEREASSEDESRIRIELSETLPEIEENDLYNLTEVLKDAGALRAVDGKGEDHSDQIICELAADIENPGHFTAVFSIQEEDGQIERGPSAEMQVEMVEPFLAFRQDEITVTAGTEYDPYRNILICMDIDGTVLTEFVAMDGYLNIDQADDYELHFYIYSRVNASSASRNMIIHVVDQ